MAQRKKESSKQESEDAALASQKESLKDALASKTSAPEDALPLKKKSADDALASKTKSSDDILALKLFPDSMRKGGRARPRESNSGLEQRRSENAFTSSGTRKPRP